MSTFSRAAILARYPHYFAIRAAARAINMPRTFTRDLTLWDRRALSRIDPSEPFVWVARDSGTHLVTADDRPRGTFRGAYGEHPSEAWIDWLEDSFGGYARQYFAWDGTSLRPVTADEARTFLREHAPSSRSIPMQR